MTADLVIEAEGLVKNFGATKALQGVDLVVPRGSVLGVLGPNGAGKTTAVRILSTLLQPDGGRAWVAGFDVVSNPAAVRRRKMPERVGVWPRNPPRAGAFGAAGLAWMIRASRPGWSDASAAALGPFIGMLPAVTGGGYLCSTQNCWPSENRFCVTQ